MQAILLGLGLPLPIATFILSLPIGYIILIIGLMVFLKYAVVPALTKFFKDTYTEHFDTNKQIVSKLSEISVVLESNTSRIDKLNALIEDISNDSIGNVDVDLAVSTFAFTLNSTHLKSLMFYNTRLRTNHFKNNEQLILSRYNSKAADLSGKLIAQLSKYHINGTQLSVYFSSGGAESYIRHLMAELYDLQQLNSLSDTFALSLTEDDIQNGLDRLLSAQMSMFKQWCLTQNNADIYINNKKNFQVKIIQNAGDIDFL